METRNPLRRLPLEGADNTRDLGGYPCPTGATRWGVYLRSDCPARLTEADIAFLKDYGVDTAVDLRRAEECRRTPSALVADAAFTTHHISINNHLDSIDFEGDLPGTMAGLYITLLEDSGDEIVQVMQALAAAKGGALFHCAVGKDRTGVIAMLLLKLAGVADADVVADYAVSDIYIFEVIDAQRRVFGDAYEDYSLYSRPASMQRVLRHLHEAHGTAEGYLLSRGLAPEEVARLRTKLTGP